MALASNKKRKKEKRKKEKRKKEKEKRKNKKERGYDHELSEISEESGDELSG